MSLLNIYIGRDRALVAVDTLSGAMPLSSAPMRDLSEIVARFQAGIQAQKAEALPHLRAVMGTCGDHLFGAQVSCALRLAVPASFDAAVEVMPAILAEVHAQIVAFRQQRMGVNDFPGAEIALVGWSDALDRMEGVRWTRWTGDAGFTTARIVGAYLQPGAGWPEPPELPDTAEKMEQVARDQVAYVAREHPDMACGGRLLLTELTRDAVTTRIVCNLGQASQE